MTGSNGSDRPGGTAVVAAPAPTTTAPAGLSGTSGGSGGSGSTGGAGGGGGSGGSSGPYAARFVALHDALATRSFDCDDPVPTPEDVFPPPGTHLDQTMDCGADGITFVFFDGAPGEIAEAIRYVRTLEAYCSPATEGATIVDGGWYFVTASADDSAHAIGTPEQRRTIGRLNHVIVDEGGGEVEPFVPGC